MKDSQLKRALHDIVAQELPNDPDLWAAIRENVQAKPIGRIAQRASRRTAATIALLAAFLVLGTAIGVAPLGQLIQQLGMVLVPQSLAQSTGSSDRMVSLTPNMRAASDTRISVDAAQRQVPFPIPQPAWLPTGLTLAGASVNQGPSNDNAVVAPVVTLFFEAKDSPGQHAYLDVAPGHPIGGYAFPSSAIQQVTVKGRAAAYASGTWNESGQWQQDTTYGALTWSVGDMTYLLHTSKISREDALRIAESLR